MPIVDSDINLRISGGVSNTDPNRSLGGNMSTVDGGIITTDVLNNDMNDITSVEASGGITIYHGYFYENSHELLTYIAPKFYIASQTSSGDTLVRVAKARESKNFGIENISNEETSPSVEFSSPANYAAGIAIDDLRASDYRGIWVEYIVSNSASAVLDQYTLSIQGDTHP